MGTTRCWLVERRFTDKGMVVMTYATPDGKRHLVRRVAAALGPESPAAMDVDDERLRPVEEPARRDRYAEEAARMADRHDPDDTV